MGALSAIVGVEARLSRPGSQPSEKPVLPLNVLTPKKKLKFLIFEEKKHREILERLFRQRYPGEKVVLPKKSFVPPIKVRIDSKTSIVDIFKAALKAEKLSEDYYKDMSQKVEEEESRKILEYLSRVERSHFFVIKSELDLLERFPEYYDVEDFHFSHEMVHFGP